MALSSVTLYNELLANVSNTISETDAITAWATAFDNYFQEATAGALPVVPGSTSVVGGPLDLMKLGLVGMSVAGAGAAKIVNGITQYWAGLTLPAVVATVFVAVPAALAITPPALGTLQSALESAFATNMATSATKEDALNAVATAINTVQILGGQAVFPVPPGGIGPQNIV